MLNDKNNILTNILNDDQFNHHNTLNQIPPNKSIKVNSISKTKTPLALNAVTKYNKAIYITIPTEKCLMPLKLFRI
jgi:hypothetical protein